MLGYVYKILNTINGKYYIGSTVNFSNRTSSHLNSLRRNTHHNKPLQKDYLKYGEKAFTFIIIEECENWKKREDVLLKSTDYDTIYNISKHATFGDVMSYHPDREDITTRISSTLKSLHSQEDNPWKDIDKRGCNNPNWKGGISGEDLCVCGSVKMVKSNLCKKCSDNNRHKENNPFFGKKHSKSFKEEHSLVMKKFWEDEDIHREYSLRFSGSGSVRFQGIYITPWGLFTSSKMAEKSASNVHKLLSNTINTWCKKQSLCKIKKVGSSHYLRALKDTPIGSTYKSIGFSFISKDTIILLTKDY